MNITFNFQGKVALITGGGGGIGRAVAVEFARAGGAVAVVDIDDTAGAVTVQAVESVGGVAKYYRADVRDALDVQTFVTEAVTKFGSIDFFFNNAGIEGVVAPIQDYPEDAFDRVMAINVKGIFLGLKYVLPIMLAQGSGSVVNTSSVSGLYGSAGMAGYVTSKHAIIGLTRVAAAEVGRKGVRVNAVCPGPIDTNMIHAIEAKTNPTTPSDVTASILARNPSGRYGQPDEVARTVLFLASDAASYVNGVAWPIDGGRSAV